MLCYRRIEVGASGTLAVNISSLSLPDVSRYTAVPLTFFMAAADDDDAVAVPVRSIEETCVCTHGWEVACID